MPISKIKIVNHPLIKCLYVISSSSQYKRSKRWKWSHSMQSCVLNRTK